MRDRREAGADRSPAATTSGMPALEMRLSEADGETVVLWLPARTAEEPCGAPDDVDRALVRVEGVVRRFALAHVGDETLSGRIRVEILVPADLRLDDGALCARIRDLEDRLARHLAALGAGPRRDVPFSVSLGVRADDESSRAAVDTSRASSEPGTPRRAAVPCDTAPRDRCASFSDVEWAQLVAAPALVFLVVAAADGRIDEVRVRAFRQSRIRAEPTDHPVLRRMYALGWRRPRARLDALLASRRPPVEALRTIGGLLAERLPRHDAHAIGTALLELGQRIAEATGGRPGGPERCAGGPSALAVLLELVDPTPERPPASTRQADRPPSSKG